MDWGRRGFRSSSTGSPAAGSWHECRIAAALRLRANRSSGNVKGGQGLSSDPWGLESASSLMPVWQREGEPNHSTCTKRSLPETRDIRGTKEKAGVLGSGK